ncbi:MAG: MFS transporter [Chloroflexota bacterium]
MSSYDLISSTSLRRRYGLITFLIWFATALPLALSVLLIQARGLSLSEIGFVMGAYSLIIVLLEVPTGGLADAIGRKRVALLAYALEALSSILLLVAFSFPAFLVGMMVYGVGRALSSGSLDAWFVDELQAADSEVRLQPELAAIETVTLLALGSGTLIGSILPQLFSALPPDGTAILTPLATPIIGSFVVRIVILVAIALLVHETREIADDSGWRAGLRTAPSMIRDSLALSRTNKRFVLLMLASCAGGFALMSLESFWQPFFAQLPGASTADGSPRTILFGVIMTGYFLVGMAGNLLAAPLSRKLNQRYGLVSALARVLQGVFMIFLAASSALVPAAAFYWLVFLTAGLGTSPHATLVNNEIPAEQRSTMLSVQSLAFYAGSFLGGAALGWLAENWSIAGAWVLAAFVIALSSVAYIALDRSHRQAVMAQSTEPS